MTGKYEEISNQIQSGQNDYPNYSEIRLRAQLKELLKHLKNNGFLNAFYKILCRLPVYGKDIHLIRQKQKRQSLMTDIASFRAFTLHYIFSHSNNNFYLLAESEKIKGALPLKKELSRLSSAFVVCFINSHNKNALNTAYITSVLYYGIDLLHHIQNESELFNDYAEMTLIQRALAQEALEEENEQNVEKTVILSKG